MGKNAEYFIVEDLQHMFIDNALWHRPRRTVVWHWLAGTAKGSIEWLNNRQAGMGSVAYNYIIDKTGKIYILGHPSKVWFHNTGKGTAYDKNTISIAFESMGANDPVTTIQIYAARFLLRSINHLFHIVYHKCHAELNSKKQDFPADVWEKLLPQILSGQFRVDNNDR